MKRYQENRHNRLNEDGQVMIEVTEEFVEMLSCIPEIFIWEEDGWIWNIRDKTKYGVGKNVCQSIDGGNNKEGRNGLALKR